MKSYDLINANPRVKLPTLGGGLQKLKNPLRYKYEVIKVAQSMSLFTGLDDFEEAQQALEELNKGKRGHYNKVPKPKHTDNKWEYMRALYAHLADFFEVPRFQLKDDKELLFAGGRIKAWCFTYNEDDEIEDEEREFQNNRS